MKSFLAALALLTTVVAAAHADDPAPCTPSAGGAIDEYRCRLAIVERELAQARGDAVNMEAHWRLTQAALVATEEKARWLTGVIWGGE